MRPIYESDEGVGGIGFSIFMTVLAILFIIIRRIIIDYRDKKRSEAYKEAEKNSNTSSIFTEEEIAAQNEYYEKALIERERFDRIKEKWEREDNFD